MRGSRNFRQGGPGQSDKKALMCFFCISFTPQLNYDVVFSQLILQKSNGEFQKITIIFQGSSGVQHFPGGGGPTFSRGGSNCLYPYLLRPI